MKKHEIIAAVLIDRYLALLRETDPNHYRNNYTAAQAGQELLDSRFQNRLTQQDVLKAMKFIQSENLARMYATAYTEPRFVFNVVALTTYVGAKSADEESAIHFYSMLGDDWALEALDAFSAQLNEEDDLSVLRGDTSTVDALDDWIPLKIDREAEQFKQQFEAIEAEIRRIEADNGFANTYPEAREGLLDSIKGTLKAIKDGVASRARIVGGLLKPLRRLARKFVDTLIAEAAKKVVRLISVMFGGDL